MADLNSSVAEAAGSGKLDDQLVLELWEVFSELQDAQDSICDALEDRSSERLSHESIVSLQRLDKTTQKVQCLARLLEALAASPMRSIETSRLRSIVHLQDLAVRLETAEGGPRPRTHDHPRSDVEAGSEDLWQ